MIAVGTGTSSGGPEANVARVYDYALGGKNHYTADRVLFDRITRVYPEYQRFAVANRHFLRDALQRMTAAGVDQFLDLGAGLPTFPSVHEIVRERIPDARVVYVDHDPTVISHCRALHARWNGVRAIEHDLRRPEVVLSDPDLTATLDLERPVGLLAVAVLHFTAHDTARQVLARYRDAMGPGSFLAVSAHRRSPERESTALLEEAGDLADAMGLQIVSRDPEQIHELFDGFAVDEPGLADVTQWAPGIDGTPLGCLAGVGRMS